MTIYVYGDATEAAKYRSTVEHYLNEMTRTFGNTSRNQNYWRQLSDTAKVHLRLINGQPFAYLYVEETLQGFVIGLQNGEILPEGFDPWKRATLLQETGAWSKKKQPYHFGNDTTPSALPYSINPSNEVIFTYKNSIYKSLKTWILPDETPSAYLDGEPLYLDDNTLFLNKAKAIVPVINSLVDPIGWKAHDELKYEWTDAVIISDLSLGVLITRWRYDAQPSIKRMGDTIEFYFLMVNETLVGTIDRFQKTVIASTMPPYLSISSSTTKEQDGQPADFIPTAGRQYTTGGEPSASGGMGSGGSLVEWKRDAPSDVDPDATWSVVGQKGSGVLAQGVNYTTYTYSASGSNEKTVTLNAGLSFILKREMEASATGTNGGANFYDTNDTGKTINVSGFDLPPGAGFGLIAIEYYDRLDSYSDTASINIECQQLPKTMLSVNQASHKNGDNTLSRTYSYVVDPPTSGVNYGAGDEDSRYYTPATRVTLPSTTIYYLNYTWNTDIEARDYIYCDINERVFIYIEFVATGAYVYDGDVGNTGLTDMTLKLCLDYRGQLFSQSIYERTVAPAIYIVKRPPDDINWGTQSLNTRFDIPQPKMPKHLFAPLWTSQGQCPHIAYRTLEEIGTLDKNGNTVLDEMLFTLRFQLLYERWETDGYEHWETPKSPSGTVLLKIPIIEEAVRHHGLSTGDFFYNIGLLWPTVSFSVPASTDWLVDVLPADWPRPISNDDEPTTGIFTKNSGDLSTWNIYRT
jgi:hypothetical protein